MKINCKSKMSLLYLCLIAAACLSLLVTNLSYDAEYQLAMAYRMIKGDTMITQMWEPHQTSAFLCAGIMKLYLLLTGTTTGIVLFTQLVGLLLRAGISFCLYQKISVLIGDTPALLAAALYLLISPKDLLVPEFSNMQLWSATLLLLSLMEYFTHQERRQLVLSAIFLCLGVLSYPSFLIAYIAVVFLLLRYSGEARRDILLFTGVCALFAGCFVGYLLLTAGWSNILECLPRALALEPSHTVGITAKLLAHLSDAITLLKVPCIILGIGLAMEAVTVIFLRWRGKAACAFSPNRWLLLSWYALMLYWLADILRADNTGALAYPLLFLLCVGFRKRRLLSGEAERFYISGLCIGVMNLLATLLLSDHGILRAIPYMQVAVCVSVLPLYHWLKEYTNAPAVRRMYTCAVHTFLLLIIFRCIYIHVPISGRGQICSLSDDLALIRSGPAMGLITDETGAAMQRDSMAEWKEYIKAGDTIWILGEPVDTLGYLYEDVEVGAPTVMSTPTYSKELLYYWEINPGKYPDVVILSSGFGELSWDLLKNDWLMSWLAEEYQAETIIDGNYWRYYFKKHP